MPTISHQTVQLGKGRHHSAGRGKVCVMELASMLAGEPFTDHPASVSRVLAAFLRGYNDGIDDGRRQTLKACAASCIGTAPAERVDEDARRRMIAAHPSGALMRLFARFWVREGATVDESGSELVGRHVGHRVARRDDDAEHDRVLELIDALIGQARASGAGRDGHTSGLRAAVGSSGSHGAYDRRSASSVS